MVSLVPFPQLLVAWGADPPPSPLPPVLENVPPPPVTAELTTELLLDQGIALYGASLFPINLNSDHSVRTQCFRASQPSQATFPCKASAHGTDTVFSEPRLLHLPKFYGPF